MLYIDEEGMVECSIIEPKRFPKIERKEISKIIGIVVHQTHTIDAKTVFHSYDTRGANGAHFLIDKKGEIYQTASLRRMTNHVGLLQSRCVVTCNCSPTELTHALTLEKIPSISKKAEAVHRNEKRKSFPDRYPWNTDSIGIELVGLAIGPAGREVYESVTAPQNTSLQWLIMELTHTLRVSMQEIYRHPHVGRKNWTEASTAKW